MTKMKRIWQQSKARIISLCEESPAPVTPTICQKWYAIWSRFSDLSPKESNAETKIERWKRWGLVMVLDWFRMLQLTSIDQRYFTWWSLTLYITGTWESHVSETWYFCHALLESARIRQIKVLLKKLRNSGDGRKVGGRRRGAKNFQTVLQPLNYRYSKGDWTDCLLAHRFYIHWFGSSELSLNEFNVVSKMEELRFCDRVGLYSDVTLQYRWSKKTSYFSWLRSALMDGRLSRNRINVHHLLPLHPLYNLRISYALIQDYVG